MSQISNEVRCVCLTLAGGSRVRQLNQHQGSYHQVVAHATAVTSGKSTGIIVSAKVFILPSLEQLGQSETFPAESGPTPKHRACYRGSPTQTRCPSEKTQSSPQALPGQAAGSIPELPWAALQEMSCLPWGEVGEHYSQGHCKDNSA